MPVTRRTPAWKRIVGAIAYLGVMAVVAVSGTALGWLNSSDVLGEAMRQKAMNVRPQHVFARGGVERDSLVLLVLGCDETRYYGGPASNRKPGQVLETAARSDMIMVAKLDFHRNRISGVSIPRDLEVRLDGYRAQKVNAYHAIGGREGGSERAKELATAAVEEVIDTKIDRTVVLDFEVFQEIVDLMGGV
ncbi:MAG: LCP family protein, partial [Fimbriimonadaceae bacterium]